MAAAPQGIHINVGRCVDWSEVRNNPQGQAPVVGNGWRITGIFEGALLPGDDRYMIRSNFGNGNETDIIFPGSVTNMYDCPGNAAGPPGAGANAPGGNNGAGENSNVEMEGGRKRRRQTRRKLRKSKKARKSSKKTRKH